MVSLGLPNPGLPDKRRKPEAGPAFTAVHKSELRTTCKLCPDGAYTGDDAVWIRGRLIGLAHRPCAVKAGAVIVDRRPAATPAPAPAAAVSRAEPRRYGGILTDRQIAVVQLLADGHTVPEIARMEQVTYQTANNTIARARQRVGVDDNDALIAVARRAGLIQTEGQQP